MERSKKPSAIPVSPVIPTPQVSISQDQSRVTATLPTGESVEVLLYGATVTSWKSASGKENLFLSSKAHLDGSKAVRGGIPLVFPVFGPPPATGHPTSGLPQHGFARTSTWEYLGKSSSESAALQGNAGDSSVKLDFGLSNEMLDEKNLPAEWKNYKFGITYSVTLGKDDLETGFAIRNTGEKEFEFKTLFHTYFAVDSINQTTITGLSPSPYTDSLLSSSTLQPPSSNPITFAAETDRIYHSPATDALTIAENKTPRFEITRDMLPNVVVWNPWEKKAAGMADLGPEEAWRKFVCVEAGSVGEWNRLEAGDTWEGGQRIRVL